MVTFKNTERQIQLIELKQFEMDIGLTLPDEYKEHLLTYNGGQCSPDVFDFIERGVKTSSSVDWFLALYEGEYDNLRDYINIYKVYNKRLPTHIIPIAHDAGGNLICISCGIGDFGYIYFWDHEREVNYSVSNDENYENIYFINSNLQLFLANLRQDL